MIETLALLHDAASAHAGHLGLVVAEEQGLGAEWA